MANPLDYKPAPWFRNGHMQTILPSIFRKVSDVCYKRERIQTPDDDFLDLDWSGSGEQLLAVISHGLEGDSQRAYVKGMVKALNEVHIDCLAWNYRTCGGETNRQLRMYHNGCTDDLDLVIRHTIAKGYENIVLIGFSMGGNLSLLYLGQQSEQLLPQLKGAVAFSVPVDLESVSMQLSRVSNTIYMKRFLRMLHRKVKEKMVLFPDQIDDGDYDQIKDFKAYDDRYTAPLHGFESAEDYWVKCSCGPLLERIRVPSLIINAEDDPFLGASCYPYHQRKSPYIYLEVPKYGGHVGFMNHRINGKYWSESRTVDFIQKHIKIIC
ncbi:MAG: alpha/beta fold hydrolase [Cyclobacteriaceae bacterium]|nr:alpha/beta fold hydrolase [Cyclobacteriaceae bacterium]